MNVLLSLVMLMLPAFQVPVSTPVKPEPAKIVKMEYDPRELAENRERTESKPETPGHKLFISRCAACHDPIGNSATGRTVGPWLDAALVTARGEATVRTYIQNGSPAMPGFQYQFDAAKVDQIVAYLKTVRPEARPKSGPQAPATPAAAVAPAAE